MSDNYESDTPTMTHRACPNCDFTITQAMADKSLSNFLCPQCEKNKLTEFRPISLDGI